MENIYLLPDGEICRMIGRKIRTLRLRQNITQMSLAEQTQISVSSIKKIEGGEIRSFDALIRVLRILGELDILEPLIREDEMSPNEYYEFVEASKKKHRIRASSNANSNQNSNNQNQSEW